MKNFMVKKTEDKSQKGKENLGININSPWGGSIGTGSNGP